LFAHVGAAAFPAYHTQHTRRITWVVAPLMLTELASAALLVGRCGRIGKLQRAGNYRRERVAVRGSSRDESHWEHASYLQLERGSRGSRENIQFESRPIVNEFSAQGSFPPLRGKVGMGGLKTLDQSTASPHPDLPPQGGKELSKEGL
jgi:hypothetical protein